MQAWKASKNSFPLRTEIIRSGSISSCKNKLLSWFNLSDFRHYFNFPTLSSKVNTKGICFSNPYILLAPLPNKKFFSCPPNPY